MKLLHFSSEQEFKLAEREAIPGNGYGCFFYEGDLEDYKIEKLQRDWPGRFPHFFNAPEEVVEGGDEFEGVVELFVKAKNLYLLKESK